MGILSGAEPLMVDVRQTAATPLPDHIEVSLAEAGELLEVLDIAAAAARTDAERAAVKGASRMITVKLWPELGDLLDGDDEA